MSHLGEVGRIISMSEFFRLGYVVGAQEEIQIVLDQFTEISIDRVLDVIIHYKGRTFVFYEFTYREMIMRDMCDPPLKRNFLYLYEYEAPYVIGVLSREVFRIHILHDYIENDQLPGAVWHEMNRLAST